MKKLTSQELQAVPLTELHILVVDDGQGHYYYKAKSFSSIVERIKWHRKQAQTPEALEFNLRFVVCRSVFDAIHDQDQIKTIGSFRGLYLS